MNNNQLNNEAIKNTVMEIVQQATHKQLLVANNNFQLQQELGLDSLLRMQVFGEIQKRFNIIFDDSQLNGLNSIDDIIAAINQSISKKIVTVDGVNGDVSHIEKPIAASGTRQFLQTQLRNFIQFYFKLESIGTGHLPQQTNFIIAANHVSHLDSICIMTASKLRLDDFVLVAAKDYYFDKKPIRMDLLRYFLNMVPFDRSIEQAGGNNNIAVCAKAIAQAKNLIIFPEATRSITGKMQDFKIAAARIAYELAIPLVPVFVKGTYEALPKNKIIPKRKKVMVRFGEPLYMETYKAMAAEKSIYEIYKNIIDDLQAQVSELGKIT